MAGDKACSGIQFPVGAYDTAYRILKSKSIQSDKKTGDYLNKNESDSLPYISFKFTSLLLCYCDVTQRDSRITTKKRGDNDAISVDFHKKHL
jgi:hypothetical protein